MKTSVIFLASMILAVSTVAQNPKSVNDADYVLLAGSFTITNNSEINNSTSTSKTIDLNFEQYMIREMESVEMEDWMFNENNFGTFFAVEAETEEPLEMEEWMINESNFNANSVYFEAETEEALELEDWMTNENNFGTFVTVEQESEEPLMLEGWMVNENIWN